MAWDGCHQEIYRNFRGERLDARKLAERGVALPPLEAYRERPAVSWQDNFPAEIPLERVASEVRRLIAGSALTVFVVMAEDAYETSFGDGKYLYPERASSNRAEAERFIEDRRREAQSPAAAPDPAKAEWYRYTLKEVPLRLTGDRLRADLNLQSFEHVSIHDVLRLPGDG